ncbi:MAG: hypothetical protein GY853_02140 [PVC group bacterium]|nr:hypothetical protein [PVC group bacterium]
MSKVRKTVQGLKERIKKNKASAVVIDGQMGEGKTTFAVRLLEEYQNRKKIDFDIQYAVGGDDFIKKLELCVDNGKTAIVYDEAGDFSKKNTLTTFNKSLDMVFQTFRTYKILIIVVLPFFQDLDRGIYDRGVVRVLFNCHSRTEEYGCLRVYNLRRIFYLLDYMRRKQPPVRQMAYFKSTPNFRSHFFDLPKERSAELDKISTMQKRERLKLANNGKGGFDPSPYIKEVLKNKELFVNDRSGKLTITKIEANLNLSYRQAGIVRELANQQL